jgi:protein transport protein SEC23
VTLVGGPCTIGPGQVVDLPLKNTIRVYLDIFENNENVQFMKPATKIYESLAKIIIDNKCTMDIWAYGLDQFGLLEMREMVNQSGGLMAMQEQFNHFIFQ